MLAWLASVQGARADGSVVINEISPGDVVGTSSWIELHNTSGTETVELGYWRLDAESGTAESSHYISLDASIPPGGYLVFERITTQLTIARSGTIRLLDLDETVVDQADYTVTEGGAAIARIPDGSSNWVVVSTPTKGSSNAVPTPTPAPTPTPSPTPIAIAHAYSNAYTDPYSIANTNTIAYADPYTVAYTHSNAYTDTIAYTDASIHTIAYARTYSNAYTDASIHTNAFTYTNTISNAYTDARHPTPTCLRLHQHYTYTYTNIYAFAYANAYTNAVSHTQQFHRHQRNLFFARQAGPSRSSAEPRSCPICFQFKWEASR